MALERVPADIRAQGGVARMASPSPPSASLLSTGLLRVILK